MPAIEIPAHDHARVQMEESTQVVCREGTMFREIDGAHSERMRSQMETHRHRLGIAEGGQRALMVRDGRQDEESNTTPTSVPVPAIDDVPRHGEGEIGFEPCLREEDKGRPFSGQERTNLSCWEHSPEEVENGLEVNVGLEKRGRSLRDAEDGIGKERQPREEIQPERNQKGGQARGGSPKGLAGGQEPEQELQRGRKQRAAAQPASPPQPSSPKAPSTPGDTPAAPGREERGKAKHPQQWWEQEEGRATRQKKSQLEVDQARNKRERVAGAQGGPGPKVGTGNAPQVGQPLAQRRKRQRGMTEERTKGAAGTCPRAAGAGTEAEHGAAEEAPQRRPGPADEALVPGDAAAPR
ncbi:neurofilament heavy polypeptide-like [Bacillus rossius redtenbacheri]|uniref:neurofilament heavy polypeptide-like n=1 Tax=Bacillus rossius redtenbacheri TaxID=93214 RepID=UPI002FDCD3B2